jgi:hypothetical protein
VRRLFAGDPRVWRAGSAVLVLTLALVAVYLLRSEEHYTGTNNVGVRSLLTDVPHGGRMCLPELEVPDGTGRVQITMLWHGPFRPALRATLDTGGRVRRTTLPVGQVPPPAGPVGVALAFPEIRSASDSVTGRLCVVPNGGPVTVAGTHGQLAGRQPGTIDGEQLPGRVAIRYLPPAGEESSLLSLLDDAA